MADKDKLQDLLANMPSDKLATITVTDENGKMVPIMEYLNRSLHSSVNNSADAYGNVTTEFPTDEIPESTPDQPPSLSPNAVAKETSGEQEQPTAAEDSAAADQIWDYQETSKPTNTVQSKLSENDESEPSKNGATEMEKNNQETYTGTVMPFSFPVQKTDFPSNSGIFFDESIFITELQIFPSNKNIFKFGNSVISTVTPQASKSLLQYGKAAPSFKLSSMYDEDKMHPRAFADILEKMDKENFWKQCKQVEITGHWNNNVLKRFTESFTDTVSYFIMRRFTAKTSKSGYRWEFAITNLNSLRYINVDCRTTESGDITAAINALAKSTKHKTLKTIFFNVKGWYYDIHAFRMAFNSLKNIAEDEATITVLTDRGLDQSITNMLQECHFEYVGQGKSESMAPAYDICMYELFNCQSRPKFTYGFLKTDYAEVEVQNNWD